MPSSGQCDPPQEVDFLLEDLYIFAPKPHSKYKLRLVVRQHSQEERISKDQHRCDFRFILEDALREDESQGEIYLLEREKKGENNEDYRAIGIGKLDLASCRQREHFSAENRLVNGLIYGTKDVKGQRIIAKFSYRMLKVHRKEETNEFLSPKPITISRRKQKFPTLAFRQSIVDRNAEINSKLNDLTRNINETYKRDKHSNEKMKDLNETIMQTLREQCKEYRFKYSEKMHSLMQSSLKRSELYKMYIKSIKINDNDFRKIQKLASYAHFAPQQQYKQPSALHYILIILSQVFERMQFRRKLIELTFPIVYNINNHLKQDVSFYLPKTNNRILLEIRTIKSAPSQVLVGYLKFGDSFDQIIEVFDEENQQKGFMIALIDQQTVLSDQYLKQYQIQLEQHHKIVSSQKPKELGKRRHSVANQRKQQQTAVSRITKPEALYQPQQNLRSDKPYKFRKVKNPQFFVSKTQQSEASMSRSRALEPQQSSMLNKSRVKHYSIPSSSNQQDTSKVRLLNFSNSKRSFKYYQKLHLESISVNLSSSLLANVRKVLLRLELNEQIHMKKVHASNGPDVNWTNIDIHFETTTHSDSKLRIGCYMKEKQGGDGDYRELGRCSISLQQMRNAPDSLYCIILVNANRIAGKVQLKFSINQSRVLSQAEQYKKQSSRLISKKKQEYQLSLNSSIVNPFAKRRSRASIPAITRRSASKKSEINKQID